MAPVNGDDNLAQRRVCSTCVSESFLHKQIEEHGQKARCSYCGNEGKTISIGDMAEHVERAFEQHFYVTPNEPSSFEYTLIKETDYEWLREGERTVDAIAGATEINYAAAEDIRLVLCERHDDQERDRMGDEGPFDAETRYDQRAVDDIQFQTEWSVFEKRLKRKERFVSRSGQNTLATIFDGIAHHRTRDGSKVVIEAGPGTDILGFYRARVFQSDEKLLEALKRPDLEVGPPPQGSAPAGRMNGHGISVFYGAMDVATALAEVRPPVGSRVAVARFQLLRRVLLLDLQALRDVLVTGSLFDSEFSRTLEKAKFLGRLSERMTRPVMPDDEPIEHLVTQVVADYVATEMNLDGMVYPSAQAAGSNANVVLLNHSARVNLLDIPTDASITADLRDYTEDGPEISYTVLEELPPDPPKPVPSDPLTPFLSLFQESGSGDEDDRVPTLKIDTSTLEIHHVSKVAITADAHPVTRYLTER